jgi:uncharacterized protein YgiM (DUF1202 family)
VIATLLLTALATTPTEFFQQGNAAYESGKYAAAVVLYDSAALTSRSAALYYNRGNAFFKQGQVGRSIADYLRAYVANPRDRDIRNNLDFARSYRPDKLLVIDNPLARMLTGILRFIDLSTAQLLAGVLFLLASAALALLFVRGDRVFGWIALGLGVLFLYCVTSWLGWNSEVNRSRVVVVVPEVTLRSGPGPDYKDIAIVHDGLEGVVRERRPGYVLVQMPGGQGGWVEDSSVEQVFGR